MRTRDFAGKPVGAVGLGCMGMSWAYGASERDDSASAALIHEAIDLGVTFLDTAQVYGDGDNETLVGGALGARRDEVVLATKTGLVVDDRETLAMSRNGTPEHVKRSAEESLRRLRTDVIDLYYLHRVDPAVPLAETWGAMAELVAEGKVRHLGLSEVTVDQAAEAHGVHPVAAVQSELSLWTRDAMGAPGGIAGAGSDSTSAPVGGPGDVVGWCRDNGAAFVPFSPLGRGFLTGAVTAADFDSSDFRGSNPRFQEEALKANLKIVDVVKAVAARHGATPAQVALAWTLAQGDHVLPIPGTKKSKYLNENAGAAAVDLTLADLTELDDVPAAVGSRY
ncbi:aldo/keto reductase [Spirillospora sp. NPDC047279]|uniref:aldo/keto reductase n=1 Tax=Spirillospora sp. NPDC047279 TaxID=3155478 RepID=UPI0033F5A233